MTETMQLRGTLRGHNGWVTQIATNPIHTDMILSCSRGKCYICLTPTLTRLTVRRYRTVAVAYRTVFSPRILDLLPQFLRLLTRTTLRLCFGFADALWPAAGLQTTRELSVFVRLLIHDFFAPQTRPWSFGTWHVTNSTTASPRNVCTDIRTSSATSFFRQMVTTLFPVLGTRLSVCGI